MPKVSRIEAARPRITPRKKVAAYARVSMETELLIHSLSAQVSHYSNLIQSNPEWEYAGVYVDAGITGTSTSRRDEFQRMVADCEDGKIDVILTKSISRFARDTVDCLNTVRRLKEIGVEVRFERERISTLSSDGELLLTLLASFAQAESESLSANVKWAIRSRFQEGIPNGHKAPYGYEWDGEMFRIIPEQGEIVKFIFQRYLAGDSGYKIAKELKKRGVVGQYGVPMCDSTIKDIVTSISYTGTMILQKNYFTESHARKRNRGELPRYAVEGMFEPLVSVEDFNKAQEIRRERAEASPNRNAELTEFSGIVKCGNCGRSFSRRTRGAAKVWVCNTRERKGINVCGTKPLDETELIEAAAKASGNGSSKRRFERITVHGDRIEFLLADGSVRKIQRKYGGYKRRNGFSGRVFCGVCGAKCERDTWKKRKNGEVTKISLWACSAPRCTCSLRRLPEEELRRASAVLTDTKEGELGFAENVERAIAYNDKVSFEFKDGTVKTWLRE